MSTTAATCSSTGAQAAPTTTTAVAKPAPSSHLRVIATWLAIYPVVAIGANILPLVFPGLPAWASTWILTGIAIPIGVYFSVPKVTLPVVTGTWAKVRALLTRVRH